VPACGRRMDRRTDVQLQSEWDKLESFHIHCQCRILYINWYDFVSNAKVLSRTELARVATIIKRRLGLFGHVARLPSSTPANQILKTCCQAEHVQIGNAVAEDPTPPGFTRSARTPLWLHLKLWSWRKIDVSGGQSQRREATAERYALYYYYYYYYYY